MVRTSGRVAKLDDAMSRVDDVKGKAYRGLAWQVGSISFSAVANIVFVMVMGRLLNPADFGQFALASVIVAMTMIFAQFGFGPALVQRQSLTDDDISFVFLATTVISVVAAGIIMAFSGVISSLLDDKVEPLMVGVLSLNLILSSLGLASRFLLVRDLEFRKLFFARSGSYVLGNMAIGFALAAAGYGAWALILGLLAGNLATSLLLLMLRPLKLNLRPRSAGTRAILGYGMGLTLVEFLNQAAQQVDKLLVGKITTLPLLGAFERAQRLQSLPITYVGNSLDGVLFSVMSQFADERKRLGQFFFSSLTLVALGLGYVSVATYFMADFIILFMLGDGWEDAQRVLRMMAVLIFFQAFPRFSDTLVRSTNTFAGAAVVKAVFLVAVVIAVPAGSAIGGFDGAVWGFVVATGIHAIGMITLGLRITGHPASDFLARVIPVFGFVALLSAKTGLLFSIMPGGYVWRLPAMLVTDLVVFGAYFLFPRLLGLRNATFVADRLGDINQLASVASVYRQRLSWHPTSPSH